MNFISLLISKKLTHSNSLNDIKYKIIEKNDE